MMYNEKVIEVFSNPKSSVTKMLLGEDLRI